MPSLTGGSQVYNVPVVFQDLRQAEALSQLFDALNNMDQAMENVYSRISSRVAEEKGKLDAISTRLRVAQAKVTHLRSQTSTATTVLSPAKYPAPELIGDHRPLFCDVDPTHPSRSKYSLGELTALAGVDNVRDTLQDVALLNETSGIDKRASELEDWEGLGRLPDNIPSITSLILFNTDENPYKAYLTLDNLAGPLDMEQPEEMATALADAPKTVAEGEKLPEIAMMNDGYKPILGDVPEFNLPNALPDLPMVANISWNGDAVPEFFTSIAPSAILPDLPDVPNAAIPATVAVASPAAAAPPPAQQQVATPAPAAAARPTAAAAPAAPAAKAAAPAAAGRGGLLDAIRKGKSLKSAKAPRKPKKKDGDDGEKQPEAASGNIMLDLFMAVNRRRKGLSGNTTPGAKRKADAGGGGGGGGGDDATDDDWS